MISLPSLDAIKTAVEMGLGIALLPRRCAVSEIDAGTLLARPLTHVSRSGSLRLVCRQRDLSPEAADFLDTAKEIAKKRTTSKTTPSAARQRGPNQVLRSISLAS